MSTTDDIYFQKLQRVTQATIDFRPANGVPLTVSPRPFADMAEVRGDLNLTEREIMEEIENQRLLWAFNFAARDEKIFLRVFKTAVEHWLNPKVPLPRTIGEMLLRLFPTKNFTAGFVDTISGLEFQQAFNVGAANVSQLLDRGWIEVRGGFAARRMGASARILLPSVVKFLEQRRLS